MRMLRAVLTGSVVACSLAACAPDAPTVVETSTVGARYDGGGFGSGTRTDSTTTGTAASTTDAAGLTSGSSGGGFGSGTR